MRITTKFISPFFGAKMSTQTFSKVFLFLNNKTKIENIFPITTGPAHENDWPTVAFGLSNRAEGKDRWPGSGLRPKADLAQQRVEGRRPRHAGVPGAMAARQLPAGRRPLPATTEQEGVRTGSTRIWRTRAGYSRGWRRDGEAFSTARSSAVAP